MAAAIRTANCFVAVVPDTSIYDGSTLMAAKYGDAFRSAGEDGSPKLCINQLDSDTLSLGFAS